MKRNKIALNGSTYFYLYFAIVWLCGAMPKFALAQIEPNKGDSIADQNKLREVAIRAYKLNKRQLSSSPLQILSGTDLDKMNSLSVADAIRYFSGVQIKDYGGIGGLKTINVRSMGTNHTAVFYDGVQLGNAQNGQVDLGKFSLDNIEEIELYNGQKSEIFQSAKGFASGSSLYLNTKQPEFKNREYNHVRAAFKTGSFGLINPSLLWQHKLSDRVVNTLNAEFKNANGKYKFRNTNGIYDTTLVRENGDIKSFRIDESVYSKLRDSSIWTAKFYFYSDEQGLPGAIVRDRYDFSQRLWNRNFFMQSTYKKEAGQYNLMAVIKYSNDYQRYLDPDIVKDNGLLNNKFRQQEVYFSLVNRYKLNSFWDVVLSGDYQRNTMDANLERFPYPTRNTFLSALATQFKFSRLDIQANVLATYVNDKVQQYFSAGKKTKLTPTVMVSWQPFNVKEFRLRSFYKSIFRMPTFNDLYYTSIGSTFLSPERTKQYDLGLTYTKIFEHKLLSQLSLQADSYYNEVTDKIVAVPGTNLFRWSMQNLGVVKIKGLDVNLQSVWHPDQVITLNAGLTYTYQQALNVTNVNLNYRNQIPYTPVHSGSFMAGAEWRCISLNYSYIYTGLRYSQSANVVSNYVPAWYTHDIAFRYNKQLNDLKGTQLSLSAEVNNLLNQYYNVVLNYPMPGRYYRFTLAYSY
ncbi:TonB-dependent receptor [Pedobacter sp. MC2016-14]|uniref:TonB-dependent receptor plug domain-containing protein n=1 Tax=Pedobacter sp. MC2016-14 TaxID=2897327 RepID=UPI001E3C9FC1|nr:TonB-dependent receptor plug domain-containing protein [Pedobacter sp. MC2016-14]MCD0489038.1 TonB-dependent receptor [Pedobacter sp. MC2016-14]